VDLERCEAGAIPPRHIAGRDEWGAARGERDPAGRAKRLPQVDRRIAVGAGRGRPLDSRAALAAEALFCRHLRETARACHDRRGGLPRCPRRRAVRAVRVHGSLNAVSRLMKVTTAIRRRRTRPRTPGRGWRQSTTARPIGWAPERRSAPNGIECGPPPRPPKGRAAGRWRSHSRGRTREGASRAAAHTSYKRAWVLARVKAAGVAAGRTASRRGCPKADARIALLECRQVEPAAAAGPDSSAPVAARSDPTKQGWRQ
jgi:hypothetical protein